MPCLPTHLRGVPEAGHNGEYALSCGVGKDRCTSRYYTTAAAEQTGLSRCTQGVALHPLGDEYLGRTQHLFRLRNLSEQPLVVSCRQLQSGV